MGLLLRRAGCGADGVRRLAAAPGAHGHSQQLGGGRAAGGDLQGGVRRGLRPDHLLARGRPGQARPRDLRAGLLAAGCRAGRDNLRGRRARALRGGTPGRHARYPAPEHAADDRGDYRPARGLSRDPGLRRHRSEARNRSGVNDILGFMKRTLDRPAGASGLLTALILGLAAVLAAGCSPAVPAGQSAPSASQHPDRSASPSPSESCGGASGSAAGAGASTQRPMLSAVQFVSPSAGWVVGSDRILHTTDGGRHWVVQSRTSQAAQLGTVDFIDASDGWVTGASEVLATTDGGAHWRALPEPCRAIRTVHFVSPDVGFGVAGGNLPYASVSYPPLAGGVLLRTTDRGQHWQQLTAPADVETSRLSNTPRRWPGSDGYIYRTADR